MRAPVLESFLEGPEDPGPTHTQIHLDKILLKCEMVLFYNVKERVGTKWS